MAPKTASYVIAFVLVAIIGMVFLTPVVQAVDDNSGQQSITNETVTAQHGEYVDLGGYAIDSSSETVWGYNDTSGSYEQATSGTDYDMNYSAGEIQANSSSSLIQDGEDIKVSYTYQASNESTSVILGFIPVMFGTLIFAKLAQGVQKQL